MHSLNQNRIQSIDIFRALTMFFMIFVNDLPSLISHPKWLGHMPADYDGMGFSDVIFPAFLFIVGLSIPFAIKTRKKKGENNLQIVWHILQRSFALIVMGFLMVNLENINNELLLINESYWQILMTLAFFLIWNHYQDKKALGRIPQWILVMTGWFILIFLVIIFKGGSLEDPVWLKPYWWGILGLIGWAYLLCSILYLFIGNRIWGISIALIILYVLNVGEFISILGNLSGFRIVVSASNHASVMSGIWVTVVFLKLRESGKLNLFLISVLILAAISLAFGFITRPEWGISKIYATPSWTAICAGISVITYLILYIISDIFQKTRWANLLAPAGKSTLTCYLIPYFVYAIFALTHFHLPHFLREGWIGILKSLAFAFLIIRITWVLERFKIRLKI